MPGSRCSIFRTEEEISELPEESTNIFQRNMLDRYIDQPNLNFQNEKYSVLDQMCLSEFFSYCYVAPKSLSPFENDSQPVELGDALIETNHSKCSLPDNIPLISSKEKLKYRKVKAVLRYHQSNPNKNIEKYAHHLLFSFFPFRDEQEMNSHSFSESYFEELQ